MNTVIGKLVMIEECKAYKSFAYIKVVCSKEPTFIELYKALSSIEKTNPIAFEKAIDDLRLYTRPYWSYNERSELVRRSFKFNYANYLALKNMIENQG